MFVKRTFISVLLATVLIGAISLEAAGNKTPKSMAIPMVVIPAGMFMMGASALIVDADGINNKHEMPQHRVTLNAFELGQTEVTQGQWKMVMGDNPSKAKECGERCPVEKVNWEDVQLFLQKLNAKTGKTYRLPTEAEWEYACKAGQETQYCGSNDVNAVAWYDANSDNRVHPVGEKKPNAFGLYDMSGNVYEWVQDGWHDGYEGAPTDGSAWEGKKDRMTRGGAWNDLVKGTLASFRFAESPSTRGSYLGFRLARTLP